MSTSAQRANRAKGIDPAGLRKTLGWVALTLVILAGALGHAQQSAGVLLQSGLYKEDVNGDLEAAIKIYEQVLKESPQDRAVVAKALIQMGGCYEKLGKDPTCAQCKLRDRCMNFCGCSNAFGSGDAATPGAFLCQAEQIHARVADRLAKALFWEGNPTFLAKFYRETGVLQAVRPVARSSADGRGLKASDQAVS